MASQLFPRESSESHCQLIAQYIPQKAYWFHPVSLFFVPYFIPYEAAHIHHPHPIPQASRRHDHPSEHLLAGTGPVCQPHPTRILGLPWSGQQLFLHLLQSRRVFLIPCRYSHRKRTGWTGASLPGDARKFPRKFLACLWKFVFP